MSRSYKKNPFITDNNKRKHKKQLANRRFRRSNSLFQRSSYKKFNETWNICDYRWRTTKKEAIEWYFCNCNNDYILKKYPTLDSYLQYWAKCNIRK